jgi:hypothetical protein
MVTADLPKQYNISFIEVLVRDPLWVYAFWEIKESDREACEKAHDFNGYCLRVIPLCENGVHSKDESFTVTISANDTARYLSFPTELSGNRSHVIKLCAIRGGTEAQIAVSEKFVMRGASKTPEMLQNVCANLSGVRDFSVIKIADRQYRTKRF